MTNHKTARSRLLGLLDQADAAAQQLLIQAAGTDAGRAARCHAHIMWAVESLMDPTGGTAGSGPVRPTITLTREPDPSVPSVPGITAATMARMLENVRITVADGIGAGMDRDEITSDIREDAESCFSPTELDRVWPTILRTIDDTLREADGIGRTLESGG